jgi:hypothetical protein
LGPPCLPLNSGNLLTTVAGHSDWISTTRGDHLAIRVFVSVRWTDLTLSQFSLRTQSITVGEPRLTTPAVDKIHHDPDPPVTAPDDDFTYRIEVHRSGRPGDAAGGLRLPVGEWRTQPGDLPGGRQPGPWQLSVVVLNARTNAAASGTLSNTVVADADNAPTASDTDQVVIGG